MSLKDELRALDPASAELSSLQYQIKLSSLSQTDSGDFEAELGGAFSTYPAIGQIMRSAESTFAHRFPPEELVNVLFGVSFALGLLVDIAEVQDMPPVD